MNNITNIIEDDTDYNKILNIVVKEVNKIFVNLNKLDQYYLKICSTLGLYSLKNKFFFSNEFYNQLFQNNNRNLISFINIFLPYLNDKNNFYNQKNIKSFQDLINRKNSKKSNDKTINNLVFSNYIYDHNRTEINQIKKDYYNTISVNISKSENNTEFYFNNIFYFVMNTISRSCYKLYVNWINIFPITLETYKDSNLYLNTFSLNDRNQFSVYIPEIDKNINLNWYNPYSNNENSQIGMFFYKGINIEDVYNTFVSNFYYDIKKIRWLIFESNNNGKMVVMIKVLQDIFNLNNFLSELSWDEISEKDKNNFNTNLLKLNNSVANNSNFKGYNINIILKLYFNLFFFI